MFKKMIVLCFTTALMFTASNLHAAADSQDTAAAQPCKNLYIPSLMVLSLRAHIKHMHQSGLQEVFASQQTLHDYLRSQGNPESVCAFYDMMLPEIARYYYCYIKSKKDIEKDMPDLLYANFAGVSIFDLLEHDLIPEILHGKLDLSACSINSLDGLEAIPMIHQVRELNLKKNRISYIPRTPFCNLPRLRTLNISDNRIKGEGTIKDIERGALRNIMTLSYSFRSADEQELLYKGWA